MVLDIRPDDLFLVLDEKEEYILDGGFEPRKGRIWVGYDEMIKRYDMYVNRCVKQMTDALVSYKKGSIDDPFPYVKLLQRRKEFLDKMVVYVLSSKENNGTGRIEFVRLCGIYRMLSEIYSTERRARVEKKYNELLDSIKLDTSRLSLQPVEN